MKRIFMSVILCVCLYGCANNGNSQNDNSLINSDMKKELTQPILNLKNRPVTQIGMVVADIEKSTKNLSEVFGIKDWTFLDLDEQYFENTIFHDKPKDTKTHLKVATANAMGVNFELLEPVSGESTHMDFLKKHGEGIHHISVPALSKDEFEKMMGRAKDAGVEIEMKSQLGKATTFTYFNMTDDIGFIFEAYTSNPNIQSTISPSSSYHYDGEGLLQNRNIWQLGIVVDNVEKAVANYQQLLGIDNWEFREIDIQDGTFRGENIGDSASVKIALANLENIQLELIEQTKGTGTFKDFLTTHGNGIHHLGINRTDGVNSYHEDLAKLKPKGVEVEMSGHITGGMFSYWDTKELLSGILMETGIEK